MRIRNLQIYVGTGMVLASDSRGGYIMMQPSGLREKETCLMLDLHTCQWCEGKSKDCVLNVHHIESRKTGGDSPDNLITLCETCHDLIHRRHQEHTIKRKSKGFRDASKMSI